VARLAHLSVRVLRHYDELGLLRPARREGSGYRLYTSEHEDEARERWGDTDAYRESARRVKSYTKEDWLRITADQEAVEAGLAEAMAAGLAPDSPEAMALAERARLGIERSFYPCSHEMHRNLGTMYVADPRFAKHYDDRAPGLARYVCDAIVANAGAHGVTGG
jgi:MerR family transcriptional regulator, thiopeptide resistance regulator